MFYPYQITSEAAYEKAYAQSIEDPENFWNDIAQHFHWKKKWNKVLEWNFTEPSIKWFLGAQLNITENCLDRHIAERGHEPAIIWEPNDPEEHREIKRQTVIFSN